MHNSRPQNIHAVQKSNFQCTLSLNPKYTQGSVKKERK